jgi:hypothetical protein
MFSPIATLSAAEVQVNPIQEELHTHVSNTMQHKLVIEFHNASIMNVKAKGLQLYSLFIDCLRASFYAP